MQQKHTPVAQITQKTQNWIFKEKGTTKMTRDDAILNNLYRYLPDKKCQNGHNGMRYTKTNICCDCRREASRRYRGVVITPPKVCLRKLEVRLLRVEDVKTVKDLVDRLNAEAIMKA